MAIMMVRPEDAKEQHKVDEDGVPTMSLRYFGPASGRDTVCKAWVVTLQNRQLRAHFHPKDQFQILLGVPGGRFQRHELPSYTVQYADAYSTYGPISGEDPPLRFFTLRAEHGEDFIGYMPEWRDKLAWRGRRQWQVGFDRLSAGAFPPEGTVRREWMREPDEDGAGALTITAGPAAVIELPGTERTSGQYVFVADGSVHVDGQSYGVESLGWQDPNEVSCTLHGGPEGARLFIVQFPYPSTVAQHEANQVAASA